MAKLTKKQRKKLKEHEIKVKEQEDKKIQNDVKKGVVDISKTTLNEFNVSSVEINNPLILEFFRALKNQKIFGIFSKRYAFRKIEPSDKRSVLRNMDSLNVGNLTILPYNSDFIRRIKILNATIKENQYDHINHRWPYLSISEALGAYAKEYFKRKGSYLKNSELYYQFVFGMVSISIAMFLMFGIIYYFWGKVVLGIILLLLFIYSCVGIYKMCKFNIV